LIRPAKHKDVVAMRPILVAVLGFCLFSGCSLMVHEIDPSTAATLLPQMSAEEAAALPEGARVAIEHRIDTSNWETSTTGIVLKASPEDLALANCTGPGVPNGVPIVSKVSYFSRLYKATSTGAQHTPVLWLPLDQISSVSVLEPPPADYVATSIEINTTEPPRIGVDFDWQAEEGEEPQDAMSE
jgi:hypothetical protein